MPPIYISQLGSAPSPNGKKKIRCNDYALWCDPHTIFFLLFLEGNLKLLIMQSFTQRSIVQQLSHTQKSTQPYTLYPTLS